MEEFRVTCRRLAVIQEENLMKRILKVSNVAVEVGRMKREEESSVICIEVVVQGKGGDRSTERSGVHDEE